MSTPGFEALPDPSGRPVERLTLPPELVTGEAVALELRPASFATRALALALDMIVLAVAALAIAWLLLTLTLQLDAAGVAALALSVLIVIFIGIPVTVETLTRGRSLGKFAAGLRVVRDDGGPIRFRHALVRGVVGVVEFYVLSGSLALITSLINPRGKRVGDLLAGTYVIRQRSRAPRVAPVQMPPALAGWASGADIGRIPDGLALAARQLIARASRLHPNSRARLGVQIADQLAHFVAPPPPAGVDPEQFLAAVLAERRRRDLERLTREQQLRTERSARRQRASVLAPTSTQLVGEEPAPAP